MFIPGHPYYTVGGSKLICAGKLKNLLDEDDDSVCWHLKTESNDRFTQAINYFYNDAGDCLNCPKELQREKKIIMPNPSQVDTPDWAPLPEAEKSASEFLKGTPSAQDIYADKVSRLLPADRAVYDSLGEKERATFMERSDVYGSAYVSHEQIGRCWAAHLSMISGKKVDDIPAYAVAQMMVIFKMLRSARLFHDDNYIDGTVYQSFAKHFQKVHDGK